jgi:hypothetical protein
MRPLVREAGAVHDSRLTGRSQAGVVRLAVVSSLSLISNPFSGLLDHNFRMAMRKRR